MPHPAQSKIIKRLNSIGYKHTMAVLFSDMVEMLAIALHNNHPMTYSQELEDRYLAVVKKYDRKEIGEFQAIMGDLAMGLAESFEDILGPVYMELEIGNARAGQFFTPPALSALISRLTMNSAVHEKIAEKGFVTISDPAGGSGGMVIAFVNDMNQEGIDYRRHLVATLCDIDLRAVHMAYIQLSLLGVPAVVVHGNSLSLEEHSHWATRTLVDGYWGKSTEQLAQLIEPNASPMPHAGEDDVAQLAVN